MIEDVRGILIAGETPEVNGVQIHQDKLGEYIRTGGTMNGRPAYFKDNNTNHMLWFAPASDGPTWYVGKREEFGQPRGWLQVKSDAPTPAEITGTWGVWVAAEKLWKEGREVQCVAVSATPGVYIHGPTPNQLLQDKLGEYRRVQQRVVTERGVYEMVGMQNVMMWYAPGGTWNIGKRDELGQNRGWYQAVSKAISPEGITNWQVWDGANRKWEKALELQAMSVGSKRVAFTGNTPRGINADKLGEFVRRGFRFENGRAVYEAVETSERSMWYCNKYWYIGQPQDVGKPQGWLCCKDDSSCPELCKATWRVSDGQQMVDAEEVACMPVGAMTVMVAGETPSQLNSDKLGEFVRQVGREVNHRPVYSQVGNENRMLWYSVGYWYLGRKDELGKSQGWLCVRDPAPAPELTQSIWRVGDGEALHDAPHVKCAAIGARCIEVLGEPVGHLHKDKMGEFKMIAAQEVNGKPVYEKDPSVSHMVWAANGYWYVGKRDELGKQAGWMQVRDSSSLPEEICGVWQIWNQSEKRWMASEGVRVTAVGNIQVSVSGPMPPSCSLHADKLGEFIRLKGQEANGYCIYKKREEDTMLWHAGGAWWVGPPASLAKQAGYWRCRDAARIPEATRSAWEVGDGTRWHVAERVRCSEYLMPRLVLKGPTPEDRHQDKLGTYMLTDETVNDRPCYHQLGNPSRMMWFLTPYWYIGKSVERGLGQGWVQVRSLAHVPEQIAGTWAIWNSSEKVWLDAADLHIQADASARAAAERVANEPLPLPKAQAEEAIMVVEEARPQASVVSISSQQVEQRHDVFLTHDWGTDGEGRRAQERVAAITRALRGRGLRVCFDDERMQGNVVAKMCSGIDDSDVIVVFVSQNYIERVAGRAGPQDHCKKEFEYAVPPLRGPHWPARR
uniref:TIR domain-containing protein n=1 Tax=Emiliania huxleyi TaxID=2903 RepID=A0A7S3RQA4_EMIHU